jgi:hypothetical protein
MSQPDNTDDAKLSARAKRRAPVIELTAAEVSNPDMSSVQKEPAAHSAESAPPDEAQEAPKVETLSTPELQSPPIHLQKPSRVMPLALAAIVGGVFGIAGGSFIPKWLGFAGADSTRFAKLERDFTQLPKASELETIKQTLARMEAETNKHLAESGKRVDDKLLALDTELKAVASKTAVPGGAQSSVGPVAAGLVAADLTPLTQRLATLEAGLKALDGKAEGAAKLSERVEQATKRMEVGTAAPMFAAGQALASAFHRGAPFANELSALEVLGAKPEQLQPLKMFASAGAPTPQRLAEGFAPLATRLAENPGESGTVMSYLQRFVKTRPVGETKGDTPSALVATIEAALSKGDLALAVAAWGRLPEPARNLSSVWAAQASDRDKAGKALSSFQELTIASLRKSTP